MTKRTCTECGITFTAKKAHAEFCSTNCRKAFNNRRAMRGAQLYDAMMNMRYDRAAAKDEDIDYTFLCRMAEMFHREDEQQRRGRRSFRTARAVKDDLGAVVNARHGDQAAKFLRQKGKEQGEARAAASIAVADQRAADLLAAAKKKLAAERKAKGMSICAYSM